MAKAEGTDDLTIAEGTYCLTMAERTNGSLRLNCDLGMAEWTDN